MENGLKVRLCGPYCPPGSAHHRYWSESLRAQRFDGGPNHWRPSPELLREMDEEQTSFDAGEVVWKLA